MLVIVSDLRLDDGSLASADAQTSNWAAMEAFAATLHELARAASFRTGGEYRPIELIDVVLLGDILDLIGSPGWLATDARPWIDPQNPATFAAIDRITAAILDRNEPSLRILRQLANGAITVPRRCTASHGAAAGEDRQPVAVRIHYMVGDRDWPLHLAGEPYARLRALVAERMGLANRTDIPFPHDAAEAPRLLDTLRRHRVLARHADIYDPIHFAEHRDTSSLGDALAIDLFARFQAAVHNLDDELSPATRAGLMALGDIRPMLLAAAWIDAVLKRTCRSAAARSHLRVVWDGLVDELLESPAIRSRDAWNPIDLADVLARTLKLRQPARAASRRASMQPSRSLAPGADRLLGSYHCHAIAEDDLRANRVKHVVYGHTQQAEFAPLERRERGEETPGPGDLDGCYFNAGSWRRVILPSGVMPAAPTLLSFYKQDERRGLSFEILKPGGSEAIHPSGRIEPKRRINPAA